MNISRAIYQKETFKDYYYKIVKEYPEEYIPSAHERVIESDLSRTFPNDPFFKKASNIEKLKNILLAYSRRNVIVGYSQGFNFIAGRLLRILGDEVSIYTLCNDITITGRRILGVRASDRNDISS